MTLKFLPDQPGQSNWGGAQRATLNLQKSVQDVRDELAEAYKRIRELEADPRDPRSNAKYLADCAEIEIGNLKLQVKNLKAELQAAQRATDPAYATVSKDAADYWVDEVQRVATEQARRLDVERDAHTETARKLADAERDAEQLRRIINTQKSELRRLRTELAETQRRAEVLSQAIGRAQAALA